MVLLSKLSLEPWAWWNLGAGPLSHKFCRPRWQFNLFHFVGIIHRFLNSDLEVFPGKALYFSVYWEFLRPLWPWPISANRLQKRLDPGFIKEDFISLKYRQWHLISVLCRSLRLEYHISPAKVPHFLHLSTWFPLENVAFPEPKEDGSSTQVPPVPRPNKKRGKKQWGRLFCPF